MNRTNDSTSVSKAESSRIPKSSALKKTPVDLVQFRREQNLKLKANSLKNEIETVNSMPTIKEETDAEIEAFNKNNSKLNNKSKDDSSSFTKYRVKASSTNTKLDNKSNDTSNISTENLTVKTNKSDDKIKKSTNIHSITNQSRLLIPTKVSLARSKVKESSEIEKLVVNKTDRLQPNKIDRSSSKASPIRTQTNVRSSNRSPAALLIKKDDTSDAAKDSLKIRNSNSEPTQDKTENHKIRVKNVTSNSNESSKRAVESASERKITDTSTYIVKATNLSEPQRNDHTVYGPVETFEPQIKQLPVEQHICRICLDLIQVDGSDLSDCIVESIESTIDESYDEKLSEQLLIDESMKSKNYISPCNCKGQSKFVHRKCLSEWIYVSKKTNCQVCTQKFRNIKINVYKKSIVKWLTDEYDHLLMLILYLIPFVIDCIFIFNFLSYDVQMNYPPSDSTLINPSRAVVDDSPNTMNENQLDSQLDQLEQQTNYELNDENSIVHSIDSDPQSTNPSPSTPTLTNQNDQSSETKSSFFSSFISFKRTKNLTRTMSLNMFIYNLYFLEMKFYLKNCSFCISGIPVTLLISFPSLILFIRYCKSRYQEWQAENLEVSIED